MLKITYFPVVLYSNSKLNTKEVFSFTDFFFLSFVNMSSFLCHCCNKFNKHTMYVRCSEINVSKWNAVILKLW